MGIRLVDLTEEEVFRSKLERNLEEKNFCLVNQLQDESFSFQELFDQYRAFGARLGRYMANTSVAVNHEIEKGKDVLFEGAQGTLLDVDHGTYPYVTSSNTVAASACV